MAPFISASAHKFSLYWRLLLLASIVIPGLVTAAAAWQHHKHLMTTARDTVERTTALAREHALKVTETNLLVLDRIEDRVHGLDWETILRQSEVLHRDLRIIDEQIEQIAALHLVTPQGLIAAVSTVFPAPAVPITDRSYFKRHKAGEAGPLFGDPIVSRISGKPVFTMTRRRTGLNGEFDGIVFGSFLPEYFQRHWELLVAGKNIRLTLLRTDGQTLVQLPASPSIETASPANDELVQAIKSAESGLLQMGSRSDGTERLVAFSQVGQHSLYIISALALSDVWAEWWRDLGIFVALGILTSACLIFLILQAGRQRRAAQEAVILHSATHDALTGLPNRRRLQERLSEMLAGSGRGSQPIAFLMIDLDRFKPVNDLYGHAAGDSLLQLVAKRLLGVSRETDVVARLGGDEFVVAAWVEDQKSAHALAQRIVAVLEAPFDLRGITVQVGCSVGVALGFPVEWDADTLAQHADAALYRAKAEGRNCCRFFESGMDTKIRDHATLVADLRQAVLQDMIEPHFQPLVDLGSGRLLGFEMLARWTHPERGEVPPSIFIPVAESSGLIGKLSTTLLHKACSIGMTWPGDITLACNISPLQLRDRSLPGLIRTALAESGFPAHRLEIELTEGALVEDFGLARELLLELKELGVRLALDDFGTGFSSLARLQTLPFDKIKIDGAFVRLIGTSMESRKIVAAVVDLGHSLGLTTVAEGVEKLAQAQALSQLGCDIGQGWLFGRALSAQAVATMFANETGIVESNYLFSKSEFAN